MTLDSAEKHAERDLPLLSQPFPYHPFREIKSQLLAIYAFCWFFSTFLSKDIKPLIRPYPEFLFEEIINYRLSCVRQEIIYF